MWQSVAVPVIMYQGMGVMAGLTVTLDKLDIGQNRVARMALNSAKEDLRGDMGCSSFREKADEDNPEIQRETGMKDVCTTSADVQN